MHRETRNGSTLRNPVAAKIGTNKNHRVYSGIIVNKFLFIIICWHASHMLPYFNTIAEHSLNISIWMLHDVMLLVPFFNFSQKITNDHKQILRTRIVHTSGTVFPNISKKRKTTSSKDVPIYRNIHRIRRPNYKWQFIIQNTPTTPTYISKDPNKSFVFEIFEK